MNDNYITSVMEFTFLHKKFVNVDKLTVYNSEELNKYNQSCWDGKYDLNLCGFPFTSDNIILEEHTKYMKNTYIKIIIIVLIISI